MSTLTSPPQSSLSTLLPPAAQIPAAIAGEPRITLRDIPWDLYDRLSDAIAEGENVHLAYDGKDLEIMVLSREHEHLKDLFARLINAITDELRIANRGAGQTTWKRPEITRGLEADLCYFFATEKLAQDRAALKLRLREVVHYPNPDLAVEIDLSPSQIDRPGIYGALRVAEVWRFDGEKVIIEQLGPDGTYVRAESSLFLPISADEITRWIVKEDSDDLPDWRARLRAWILAELAPRVTK